MDVLVSPRALSCFLCFYYYYSLEDSSTYLISCMRDTRRDGIAMKLSDFLLSGTCDTVEEKDMMALLHSDMCVRQCRTDSVCVCVCVCVCVLPGDSACCCSSFSSRAW